MGIVRPVREGRVWLFCGCARTHGSDSSLRGVQAREFLGGLAHHAFVDDRVAPVHGLRLVAGHFHRGRSGDAGAFKVYGPRSVGNRERAFSTRRLGDRLFPGIAEVQSPPDGAGAYSARTRPSVDVNCYTIAATNRC
jgi:hypothetical protein